MTMRKREEIEYSAESQMEQLRQTVDYAHGRLMELNLEVLLDIRSLLTPVQFEVRKPSDEEIQKVIEHWKKAHDDRP